MSDFSNLGVILSQGSGDPLTYVVIGEVTNLDFPEIKTEVIESTSHNDTWKTYAYSGLMEAGEFTATIKFDGAETFTTDMKAKTVGDYEISFPNSVVWTFKALITSVKPGGADAQSPELLELEVTFQPSGEMTIA